MEKLKDYWFAGSLTVGGQIHPSRMMISNEIQYDIIISVDSQFDQKAYEAAMYYDMQYWWFPMNECSSNMGINSIYAAMQILWNAEKHNKKVYLHCAAGANRSPTVKECYHYMRTQTHRASQRVECDPQIQKMFVGHENETHYFVPNKLLQNIEDGFLPAREKMEIFLIMLNNQLLNGKVDLEELKMQSKIS